MAQAPLGSKPGGSAAAVTTHTAGEAPYAPDTGRSAAYYTPRGPHAEGRCHQGKFQPILGNAPISGSRNAPRAPLSAEKIIAQFSDSDVT